MEYFTTLIDLVLAKELTFEEFKKILNRMFATDDKVSPYFSLSSDEQSFVEEVYEKSTFTASILSKDDPDRQHGVIDIPQFSGWLSQIKDENIDFWKKNVNHRLNKEDILKKYQEIKI